MLLGGGSDSPGEGKILGVIAFSALTLLVGGRKGIRPVKN